MDKTLDGTPEEPRDWDPNHPMLKSPLAPHETAGVLRMQRAGWPGKQIAKLLNLGGIALMESIQAGIDAEGEANRLGRPIHDAVITKGASNA